MDFVDQYNKLIQPHISSHPLYFLQNAFVLKQIMQDLKMPLYGDAFQNAVAEKIARFSDEHAEQLNAYLSGETNLNSICHDFIQFIFDSNHNEQLDADVTKQVLSVNIIDSSDFVVKTLLAQHPFRDEIKIFGFGLGDGSYEIALKNFLTQQGLIKDARIYGYDPYAMTNGSINYLELNELSNGLTSYDLILSRWALHHVPVSQRWRNYIDVLNCLSPDGISLIIEHGFESHGRPIENRRVYRLLNGFMDVLANISIFPEWFTSTLPSYGKHFYVDYLGYQDVNTFIDYCKQELKADYYETGPLFPWQTVISLTHTR